MPISTRSMEPIDTYLSTDRLHSSQPRIREWLLISSSSKCVDVGRRQAMDHTLPKWNKCWWSNIIDQLVVAVVVVVHWLLLLLLHLPMTLSTMRLEKLAQYEASLHLLLLLLMLLSPTIKTTTMIIVKIPVPMWMHRNNPPPPPTTTPPRAKSTIKWGELLMNLVVLLLFVLHFHQLGRRRRHCNLPTILWVLEEGAIYHWNVENQ